MKQLKFFGTLCLIFICWTSPLQGQNGARDSLIDESLRDFFSKYNNLPHRNSKYMIAAHTFPYDYNLSSWIDKDKIGIANFNDKRTIKQYKKTKDGIPTVCLKWRIDRDGFVIYKVALYYVKIRGKTIDSALSDVCTYYYKYLDSEKKWMLTLKSCSGV